jgi:hypothetical protein
MLASVESEETILALANRTTLVLHHIARGCLVEQSMDSVNIVNFALFYDVTS